MAEPAFGENAFFTVTSKQSPGHKAPPELMRFYDYSQVGKLQNMYGPNEACKARATEGAGIRSFFASSGPSFHVQTIRGQDFLAAEYFILWHTRRRLLEVFTKVSRISAAGIEWELLSKKYSLNY